MSFLDKMKDVTKKGLEEAKKVQEKHNEKQVEKQSDLKSRGIVLQLKSAEGLVSFYEDKIEIKNLLGSKVRNIFYTQVEGVYLDKTSGLAKGAAAAMTMGMSLAVTNKKTLVISTGDDKFKMDFRVESLDKINKALDLVNNKIKNKYNPQITVNVDNNSSSRGSVADELVKLAKLKEQGIIDDEEFKAQKSKILKG